MSQEVFRGASLRALLEAVRHAHGENAMIVGTRGPSETGYGYEVTVAPAAPAGATRRLAAPSRADRPTILALIGPPGGGKTTAAVRLALGHALERSRVALLTLDNFKVGALEQMQLLAELTGLPLDLTDGTEEIAAVRERLGQYDMVIVDTPGRRSGTGDAAWAHVLAALAPDEVHLVVNAGLRDDVIRGAHAAYGSLAPDHVLLTHTDTLPPGADPLAAASSLRLPVRWLSDAPDFAQPLRAVAARAAAPSPPALSLWDAHALAGARVRG